MQSHFPLGFNDNIYHDGIFLKCEILMFFLFWNVITKNVKVDPMVIVKMATLSAKCVLKQRLNTSLKNLSSALNNHGWHGLFSFVSSLPF